MKLLKVTVGGIALACLIASDAFAGFAALTWRYQGQTALKSGTINVCGKAETIDVRVSYSLNPTFPIGEPDPNCP